MRGRGGRLREDGGRTSTAASSRPDPTDNSRFLCPFFCPAGSAAGAPLTVHGEFLSAYKRPAAAPEAARSDSEGEDAWGGGEGGDAYRQRRKMARVG